MAIEPDNFTARLQQVIRQFGTVSAFSRHTTISRRTIGAYLSGQSDPTRLKLIELARAGGVSVEWLATGAGEQVLEIAESGMPYGLPPQLPQPVLRLPCLDLTRGVNGGVLAGGDDLENINIDRGLLPQQELQVTAAARAIDDAMMPSIHAGDLVLLSDPDPSARLDGVHLVALNSRPVLRRLQWRSDNQVDLICDNAAYATLTLDLTDDKDQFRNLGVVRFKVGALT